jgi:hypothetical protein
MQDDIRGFLDYYEYLLPEGDIYSEQITVEQTGVRSLQKAFNAAKSADKKIYVIIDEYDLVHANGSIRTFYEMLKEGSKNVVDRIIFTGVTPIMLNDITSGFNISTNLSLNPGYNEMLGFTKDEVNLLMQEAGVDPGMIGVDMEYYYNGYLFHPAGKNKVYNPSMILYLFDQVLQFGRKTKNIIDENLKTDYSRLQMLIQSPANHEQLIKITNDNTVISDIIPRFSRAKLQDNEYFVSLLFYMGLLTIDKVEEGLLHLKIPNYSMRTICWDHIKEMTADNNPEVLINVGK